ncbi:MAG: galactosyldiacylglycerol synthase [Alicyclobacillus herbarius]|uniref:MGDG synthase family glycosyltransferase n=1 Tax=Alicyclobacillus herbarius TaxID=122960 RepID=UPI002355329D|nr:glycosyltransferase [Alicyclobacillus herbarius]MCL6633356.1 galactosyldiacylglycerol synthase [Alicyclobacillus herbarius]
MKALLLTAHIGDGHHQVARALHDAFTARGVETVVLDIYRETSPRIAKLNERTYEWTTRFAPHMYGMSYRVTARFGPDHTFWKMLSAFSRQMVLQQLEEQKPDIVLQLFPDHALASLSASRWRPYIGEVITDFTVHGRWFHHNIDTYFIANASLAGGMEEFLQPGQELVVSGIPIRQQFLFCRTQSRLRAERPYILYATGGRGVFPHLLTALRWTGRLFPNHAVYVMCGRNSKMYQQVARWSEEWPHIHPLPFVEHVADWLQGADFAVVKSGGVTVSECLASTCPMLIFRPQPGQESDNAEFLSRHGAAKAVASPAEFVRALRVLRQPGTREQMRAACQRLARPDAAWAVVEHALQQAERKRAMAVSR